MIRKIMAARKKRANTRVNVGMLSRATFVATKDNPQKTMVATKAVYIFMGFSGELKQPLVRHSIITNELWLSVKCED